MSMWWHVYMGRSYLKETHFNLIIINVVSLLENLLYTHLWCSIMKKFHTQPKALVFHHEEILYTTKSLFMHTWEAFMKKLKTFVHRINNGYPYGFDKEKYLTKKSSTYKVLK